MDNVYTIIRGFTINGGSELRRTGIVGTCYDESFAHEIVAQLRDAADPVNRFLMDNNTGQLDEQIFRRQVIRLINHLRIIDINFPVWMNRVFSGGEEIDYQANENPLLIPR